MLYLVHDEEDGQAWTYDLRKDAEAKVRSRILYWKRQGFEDTANVYVYEINQNSKTTDKE